MSPTTRRIEQATANESNFGRMSPRTRERNRLSETSVMMVSLLKASKSTYIRNQTSIRPFKNKDSQMKFYKHNLTGKAKTSFLRNIVRI